MKRTTGILSFGLIAVMLMAVTSCKLKKPECSLDPLFIDQYCNDLGVEDSGDGKKSIKKAESSSETINGVKFDVYRLLTTDVDVSEKISTKSDLMIDACEDSGYGKADAFNSNKVQLSDISTYDYLAESESSTDQLEVRSFAFEEEESAEKFYKKLISVKEVHIHNLKISRVDLEISAQLGGSEIAFNSFNDRYAEKDGKKDDIRYSLIAYVQPLNIFDQIGVAYCVFQYDRFVLTVTEYIKMDSHTGNLINFYGDGNSMSSKICKDFDLPKAPFDMLSEDTVGALND